MQTAAHGAAAVQAHTQESSSLTSFHDFTLNDAITRALAEEKYLTPTPIQAQTIPIVMSGRDVVGIAQTGTGKTAAFALPVGAFYVFGNTLTAWAMLAISVLLFWRHRGNIRQLVAGKERTIGR